MFYSHPCVENLSSIKDIILSAEDFYSSFSKTKKFNKNNFKENLDEDCEQIEFCLSDTRSRLSDLLGQIEFYATDGEIFSDKNNYSINLDPKGKMERINSICRELKKASEEVLLWECHKTYNKKLANLATWDL